MVLKTKPLEVAQRYEEIERYHTEQIDRDCGNKQFRKCVMHEGVCINCKETMFKPHYPKDDNEQEDFDTGDHYVRINGKYYTHYEKDMMDIKEELQDLQLELGSMGIANNDRRVLAISDRIFDIIKKYEKAEVKICLECGEAEKRCVCGFTEDGEIA